MKLDTKRRKSRQRGAPARPAAPSAPLRDAWPPRWRPPAGSRARPSVLELIKPSEPPRFYGSTCVSKCGATGRICF